MAQEVLSPVCNQAVYSYTSILDWSSLLTQLLLFHPRLAIVCYCISRKYDPTWYIAHNKINWWKMKTKNHEHAKWLPVQVESGRYSTYPMDYLHDLHSVVFCCGIGSGNDLALNRRQAIAWTNIDQHAGHRMTALGLSGSQDVLNVSTHERYRYTCNLDTQYFRCQS